MDGDGKNIQESLVEATNLEWLMEFSVFKEVSYSFEIKGIPNITWFIKFELILGEYIQISFNNTDDSSYYFQNPVKIEISLGIFPNKQILSRITDELSSIVYLKEFNELRQLFVIEEWECESGCAVIPNSEQSLFMKLKVEPFKRERNFMTSVPMKNNFEPFFVSDDISDFVFQINNKEFPAHKIMLASVSPVFEKMFSHQMKENIMNKVELNDTDPDVFEEMLRYIYTGEIKNLSIMAFGLYELANKYDIPNLQIISEQSLEDNLSADNVIYTLDLADRFNSWNLKDKCIKYVEKNFAKIKETEPFKDLKRELLMDILCAVIAKK